MKKKRGYRKPGLRSFDSDRLREDAAMAFLQAGSPLVRRRLSDQGGRACL